jgi:hypothetical protein
MPSSSTVLFDLLLFQEYSAVWRKYLKIYFITERLWNPADDSYVIRTKWHSVTAPLFQKCLHHRRLGCLVGLPLFLFQQENLHKHTKAEYVLLTRCILTFHSANTYGVYRLNAAGRYVSDSRLIGCHIERYFVNIFFATYSFHIFDVEDLNILVSDGQQQGYLFPMYRKIVSTPSSRVKQSS